MSRITGQAVFMLAVFGFGFQVSGAQEGRATLGRVIEAHGGLGVWQSFHTMCYATEGFPLGANAPMDYRQKVDLRNRRFHVEASGYAAGFDGNDAWVTPSIEALGLPPRFFLNGNFYFVGMPFVFADFGSKITHLGHQKLEGKTYEVISVTFKQGVGDTAEDDYVLFVDLQTSVLKMIHFKPTYVAIRGGASIEDLPRKALIFDSWQMVDGLSVPRRLTFYTWEDNRIVGEGSTYTIQGVSFSHEPISAAEFSVPVRAVIDESHIVH